MACFCEGFLSWSVWLISSNHEIYSISHSVGQVLINLEQLSKKLV